MQFLSDNMDVVDLFEDHLCEYTGFRNAVCVDCCTNGILLSLRAKEILGGFKYTDLIIPSHTYLSVPMTLQNNGYKISFRSDEWTQYYDIKFNQNRNTGVIDAATMFFSNMFGSFKQRDDRDGLMVCVSFQQKKRLSLGRGGVILFDNPDYNDILRKLRYDGRNPRISDSLQVCDDPSSIICGYHCYMEPDKAAQGIVKLNQDSVLRDYQEQKSIYYPDISDLEIWK